MSKKTICKNKKAFFSYEVIERYVSGIVLVGSEVKSIKTNNVSILEAYCSVLNNELFIKGMNVSLYKEGGKYNNHEPLRVRKLLMKKKEITRLSENSTKKGLTIIPLEVFISSSGFIKIEIGLCKGKNLYDKKNTIKIRDLDREIKKNL